MMRFITVYLILAFSVFFTSCSSAKEKVTTITLSGTDQMQYDITSFEVKAGAKVKLILKHIGALPKASMGHNVVILNQGIDPVQFGLKIAENGGASGNGYIPTKNAEDIVAYTSMIGGGEETFVEFTAPTAAGDYPYMCSFPGHFALMKGVMTVK